MKGSDGSPLMRRATSKPSMPGHHDVEQDQIRRVSLDPLERLLAFVAVSTS